MGVACPMTQIDCFSRMGMAYWPIKPCGNPQGLQHGVGLAQTRPKNFSVHRLTFIRGTWGNFSEFRIEIKTKRFTPGGFRGFYQVDFALPNRPALPDSEGAGSGGINDCIDPLQGGGEGTQAGRGCPVTKSTHHSAEKLPAEKLRTRQRTSWPSSKATAKQSVFLTCQ